MTYSVIAALRPNALCKVPVALDPIVIPTLITAFAGKSLITVKKSGRGRKVRSRNKRRKRSHLACGKPSAKLSMEFAVKKCRISAIRSHFLALRTIRGA